MPEEIVADYDIRSPASRTLLTVIGTLVAVGLFAGAVLGVSILMKDTKTSTSIIELGDSAQIVVNATTADIKVVEGADDVVKVTSKVTSGLRKTDFLIGRKGDEIKVISGCTTWLSPGCGATASMICVFHSSCSAETAGRSRWRERAANLGLPPSAPAALGTARE